jgi:hypothetical protein
MTDVAIIGCGPAGLLAAHAVWQAGHTPHIYSDQAVPSPVHGGVYLHQRIPGVHLDDIPDGRVTFRKMGKAEGYATKVYGHAQAPTSWERLAVGQHPAWRLATTYGALWASWGETVQVLAVGPQQAAALAANYPVVLNSAPLHHLCYGGHQFPERPVWYLDTAPPWVGWNVMVYNGDLRTRWFRTSAVFGHRLTEYPCEVDGARVGRKVLLTDCTCHPDIIRIGRWGEWRPGVLLHHAYLQAKIAAEGLDAV